MKKDNDPAIYGWTTDGYWWIGSLEDNKISGQLIYVPGDRIRLLINGSFVDLEGAFTRPSEVIPIINGITRDGKFVCLTGCTSGPSTLKTPGYLSQEYYVNAILVGIHANATEDLQFDTAFFEIDHIWTWVQPRAFSQSVEVNPLTKRMKSCSVTFTHPEFEVYQIGDFTVSFFPTYSFLNPTLMNRSVIESGISVGYKFKNPLSASTLTNTYGMAFQELICLGLSKHCKIRRVYFQSDRHKKIIDGEISDQNQIIQCLLSAVHGEIAVDIPMGQLFTFRDIEENALSVFRLWFEKREQLSPVYALYFHVIRQKDMLIQHAFLSLVNCLEVFHRRVMQKVDMESHQARMKEIKKSVNSEQWEWLGGRLGYSYEPGLKKRLGEIYDKMPAAVGNAIGERSSYVDAISTSRNYLTHFDAKLAGAHKGDLMSEYIYKMRMQIRVLLLQEVGFSEEQIVKMIQNSQGFLFVPKSIPLH